MLIALQVEHLVQARLIRICHQRAVEIAPERMLDTFERET
jgi:hypothetical protein